MPTKLSDKCLAGARKVIETKQKLWVRDIAAGGYVDNDGEIITQSAGYRGGFSWEGYVCHGFMMIQPDTKGPFVYVGITNPENEGNKDLNRSGGDKNDESAAAFVKFLCETSPVRNFILNREDPVKVRDGGYIIDCLAAGPDITLWICKVFRYLYEDTWRPIHWYELVKEGVHPMLALAAASAYDRNWSKEEYNTHNSVGQPPASKKDVRALFIDHLPEIGEWAAKGSYPTFDTKDVFPGKYAGNILPKKGAKKKVRVPDGWGGYIEKEEAGKAATIAEQLLQLQKECM